MAWAGKTEDIFITRKNQFFIFFKFHENLSRKVHEIHIV